VAIVRRNSNLTCIYPENRCNEKEPFTDWRIAGGRESIYSGIDRLI